MSVRAKWTVVPGLVGDELVGLEIHAPAFRLAHVDPRRAAEVADHGAVLGSNLADILRADHAAGAVHVLHDHVRRAVDMPSQIFREQPALDVGRPAGGEVDQQGEALALVERLLRTRLRGSHSGAEGAKPDQHSLQSARTHGMPPSSSCGWRR